jgi:DNA-binding NtrC family response regulator
MKNILVCDDFEAVCDALTTLFAWQGHKVMTADSPESALQVMHANTVDLVLQDMNFTKGEMGGKQGQRLFYKLREQYPDVPIILMTAWASLDMVVELIKAGATDYIAKPWDDQRLLTTVIKTLTGSAAYQRAPGPGAAGEPRGARSMRIGFCQHGHGTIAAHGDTAGALQCGHSDYR